MGEQVQVDRVEFRKGGAQLHAFCATIGYSGARDGEIISDMKKATLLGCHERAFAAFGGVLREDLYDSMATVVTERGVYGEGQHRFYAEFLDFAKHGGFVINCATHTGPRPRGRSSPSMPVCDVRFTCRWQVALARATAARCCRGQRRNGAGAVPLEGYEQLLMNVRQEVAA